MDSTLESFLQSEPTGWSPKQSEQYKSCTDLLATFGIEVLINVPYPQLQTPRDKRHEMAPIIIDVEHNERGEFVCIGLLQAGSNHAYIIFDLALLDGVNLRTFPLVGHNFKSDIENLKHWGLYKDDGSIDRTVGVGLVHDTEIIAHILDSSSIEYGLKFQAQSRCGISYPSYDDIVGKRTKKQAHPRVTLDLQPRPLVAAYNACDLLATRELLRTQLSLKPETKRYFEELELPVCFIFSDMENRGVRIDLTYLNTLKTELEAKLEVVKGPILNDLGPINLNSPKQLLAALNQKGIYPKWRNKDSTDKRALAQFINEPIIQQLSKYSEIDTLLSSFVYPYLERGTEYIHPFFNQCGTRTGRPSCSNPNLLQIPTRTDNGKAVRKMFIARSGMQLGDCDYGQIEPRVLAHFSKDPNLCNLFNNGTDFHEFTSENCGISRDRAKVLNLSVGYRATWRSVSLQLKCDEYEANKQIAAWWELFPVLRRWEDQLIWDARRRGYITTLLGRRIYVDGLDNPNPWQRESAERQVINNITQASAAEVMKMGMIKVSQNTRLLPGFGILIQVYDELLVESPNMAEDLPIVKFDLERGIKLDVPLVVEGGIGENWCVAKG